MAVVVDSTTNMTELWDADTLGSWSSAPSLFDGFQREGTNCFGIVVSNATLNTWTTVTSFNFNTNRIWIWISPRGTMDTMANGGVRIVVGDGTNRMAYYVGGSDYSTPFTTGGGWYCYLLDRNNLPTGKVAINGSEGSMNWSAITQVGVGFKTLSKSLGGAENCFWDIARQGTGLIIGGGTSGDPGTWAEVAADDASTAAGKAYGVVMEFQPGVYGVQGQIYIGNLGTASSYFKDTGATVVFMDTGVSDNFYQFNVVGNSTGTNVFIDGVQVGTGDDSRGRNGSTIQSAGPELIIDFSNSNIDTLTLYGTRFVNVSGGISFGSDISQELYGVGFATCGQVDVGAVIVRNCNFSETSSTVAALLWSGSINIKNSLFAANTTGAGIEHPSATGSPFAYDNLTFAGNTYDVNNTSGSAIEVNKNNGSNPNSYTGSLVTFLGASVTTQITVKDLTTGGNIENARVLVWVTDSSNFPYQASVSITGTGTTATVTHNSHGLATGDYVIIEGANEDEYNGVYQITVTGANTYTYTTNETITASPATGTITATFAFISGLTNVNGVISDTRQVGADQPIAGRVRKATVQPYYQQGRLTGTVSSTAGFSTIIQLARDE